MSPYHPPCHTLIFHTPQSHAECWYAWLRLYISAEPSRRVHIISYAKCKTLLKIARYKIQNAKQPFGERRLNRSKIQNPKSKMQNPKSTNSDLEFGARKTEIGLRFGRTGCSIPAWSIFFRNRCEFPKITILGGCRKLAPTFWPRNVETRGCFLMLFRRWDNVKNGDETRVLSRLTLTHVVGSPYNDSSLISGASLCKYSSKIPWKGILTDLFFGGGIILYTSPPPHLWLSE